MLCAASCVMVGRCCAVFAVRWLLLVVLGCAVWRCGLGAAVCMYALLVAFVCCMLRVNCCVVRC